MSAKIIPMPRKMNNADKEISAGIAAFCDSLIAAMRRADEALCQIDPKGLRAPTQDMIKRLSEHLDDLEQLAQKITVTRNLARFQAHYIEKTETDGGDAA